MAKKAGLSLTEPGKFVVGCNYWASHAGTSMWSDWRPEVVAEDLRELSTAGVQVMRVFPLWPDFQPLQLHMTAGNQARELRLGESPLPDDAAGQAGVSAEALAKFADFTRLCRENDLKILVGLVTGWMSGRLFVPPGLQGWDPISDPRAVMWEVRFVKHFVREFISDEAILAWDLGNECNCMGQATREQAWTWTAAISHAIRAVDPSRPIVSGMHSVQCGVDKAWQIRDQAELTDVLTTHPYPIFTPHCDLDPVTTLRPILHGAAESRLYADVGGKPCLVEETGSLGPTIGNEETAAAFLRGCLFSDWAHDCHGLLWWCAYDQAHLEKTPYDWTAVERELGLFRQHGAPKAVMREMAAFRKLTEKIPTLSPRRIDAVCLLPERECDQWGAAFGAFMLAKQAGVDIEFQLGCQPLKPAAVYLAPSLRCAAHFSRRTWLSLREKIEAGATLVLSQESVHLSPFAELAGIESVGREKRMGGAVRFGDDELPVSGGSYRLRLKPITAEVLACDADGVPAFTRAPLGKGQVYFLNFPLEMELLTRPGAAYGPRSIPYWKIYRRIFGTLQAGRIVGKTTAHLGLTEHEVNKKERLIVAINYSPDDLAEDLALASKWKLGKVYHGTVKAEGGGVRCGLGPNQGAVFSVVG